MTREIVSPAGAYFAEFASAREMRDAVAALRRAGYEAIETFSSFEVPGADDERSGRMSRLGVVAFVAGVLGAVAGYALQWYVNAVSYPLDIGGRPTHAIPAFIISAFEGAVLFAAVAGFVATLVALRLPRLWQPVFEIDGFDRATVDRYWLALDLRDPRSSPESTLRDLTALAPLRVVRLEGEGDS